MANPFITEIMVRGDDAGASISANRAIVECFTNGVLGNTSVMAIGPALADAAERLAKLPGLCIGLHVALNSEWSHPRFSPILPKRKVQSLIEGDGCFLRSPKLIAERGFVLNEAVAEVTAQLQALREAGLEPQYLDEHMGVGWLPGLADALADLAHREGLVVARENARVLPPLSGGISKSADRVDERIDRVRAAPVGRYVLVTHPVVNDEESRAMVREGSPPGVAAEDRDQDRRALLDPRLWRLAETGDVRFVKYTDPTRTTPSA